MAKLPLVDKLLILKPKDKDGQVPKEHDSDDMHFAMSLTHYFEFHGFYKVHSAVGPDDVKMSFEGKRRPTTRMVARVVDEANVPRECVQAFQVTPA